jgi:uncharacterized SAM-binding protein YcdF (DUF218 family)
MMLTPASLTHAQTLWDYNALEQPPVSADLLLVMGHSDLGVPRRAAELAKTFDYTWIVTTGGVHHDVAPTGEAFGGLEGDVFKREIVRLGVDASRILVEDQAKNTGDNVTMSRALLAGKAVRTGQLVHHPVMRRRAYATAAKQWPDVTWHTTSQQIGFHAYLATQTHPQNVLTTLVGDTYRILTYPAQGFQIEQTVPDAVKDALWALIDLGFGAKVPADAVR